jgi:hypothetical protein
MASQQNATSQQQQRDVPRYANAAVDEHYDGQQQDDNDDSYEGDEESVAEPTNNTNNNNNQLPGGVSQNSPMAAAATTTTTAQNNDIMRTPPRVNSRPGTAGSPFAHHLRLPTTPNHGHAHAHAHGHGGGGNDRHGMSSAMPFSPPMASSTTQTPLQPHPSASPIAHRDMAAAAASAANDQRVVSRSSKSKTQTRSHSASQSHSNDDNENDDNNNTDKDENALPPKRSASPQPQRGVAAAARSDVSMSTLSSVRPQPSVPPTPSGATGVAATGPLGGETKSNDATAAGSSPTRPRKHIYPFSPKKPRRADVLQYPHPVVDYDEEQARHNPPPSPLIPNAWQLDFFRIFSIMIGILILLPTVFHTKRNSSYDGTAYATWQVVAMSLQIIGGAILLVTIISVSFAPTVYTR